MSRRIVAVIVLTALLVTACSSGEANNEDLAQALAQIDDLNERLESAESATSADSAQEAVVQRPDAVDQDDIDWLAAAHQLRTPPFAAESDVRAYGDEVCGCIERGACDREYMQFILRNSEDESAWVDFYGYTDVVHDIAVSTGLAGCRDEFDAFGLLAQIDSSPEHFVLSEPLPVSAASTHEAGPSMPTEVAGYEPIGEPIRTQVRAFEHIPFVGLGWASPQNGCLNEYWTATWRALNPTANLEALPSVHATAEDEYTPAIDMQQGGPANSGFLAGNWCLQPAFRWAGSSDESNLTDVVVVHQRWLPVP